MAFSFNGLLGLSPKEVPKNLSGPNLPSQAQCFCKHGGETLETIQNQALWNEARGQRTMPHNWEERKGGPWSQRVRLWQGPLWGGGHSLADGVTARDVCHWCCGGWHVAAQVGLGERVGQARPEMWPTAWSVLIAVGSHLSLSSVDKHGFLFSWKLWVFTTKTRCPSAENG